MAPVTLRPPAVRRLVPLAVSSVLLLTGCGAASPGAAVVIGDERVSTAEVVETARDICRLSEAQLAESSQVVPMSVMTQRAVELLTLARVGPMIAADLGIDPGAEFERQTAGLEQSALSLPEAARDTYIELSSAITYANLVTQEAGRRALSEDGVTEPTEEDLAARGERVLSSWLDQNDVRVNPRYGIGVVDGSIATVATDTSVAVSDLALSAGAEEVDIETARTLPDSQRCP